MASWNDLYPIFNDSILIDTVATRAYVARRVVARVAEARRQISKNRYWSIDLSGLILSGPQLEEVRALEALARGPVFPVLVRIASFCLLESESGLPAFLGTGNGTLQTFQLHKTTQMQGRTLTDEVKYPNWDYPPLYDLNGESWFALPQLRVWRGVPIKTGVTWSGQEITSNCNIERNGGLVTTNASGSLYVTGGFYTRMLAPSSLAVSPTGGCWYEVKNGVQMIEPFPGLDELGE